MPILINNREYLVGPANPLGKLPKSWKDTGLAYAMHPVNRRLYLDDRGHYWLVWVPLNSQWPYYAACRTQEYLLRGWS